MAAGCARRDPIVTYFDAPHGVSLRYPASWRLQAADPAATGGAYRHFRAPGSGALSATTLARPVRGTLYDTLAGFTAGKKALLPNEVRRGSLVGVSCLYSDGAGRYGVVLIPWDGQYQMLLLQGDEASWTRHAPAIAEMMASFQVERAADYPEHREPRFGFALRVPPSWRETQGFARADTLLRVYASPVLAVDGRDGVQASLTVTVEPLGSASLDDYYQRKRKDLGDAFAVVKHEAWRDGYVDTIVTETAVMTSRIRRFYRVSDRRGYCLAFEAREDVFARASGWFDLIANTLALPSKDR